MKVGDLIVCHFPEMDGEGVMYSLSPRLKRNAGYRVVGVKKYCVIVESANKKRRYVANKECFDKTLPKEIENIHNKKLVYVGPSKKNIKYGNRFVARGYESEFSDGKAKYYVLFFNESVGRMDSVALTNVRPIEERSLPEWW